MRTWLYAVCRGGRQWGGRQLGSATRKLKKVTGLSHMPHVLLALSREGLPEVGSDGAVSCVMQ